MISKKEIKKLNSSLRKGDKKEIGILSGFSQMTLNKFFCGRENEVSDEVAQKIVEATAVVIRNRNKIQKATKEIISSL